MGAEPAHRLGLARDPVAADVVQAFGLDQREGDVAIEQRVVGEVDLLLAALAEEFSYSVSPVGERRGHRRGCGVSRWRPAGAGGLKTLPYGCGGRRQRCPIARGRLSRSSPGCREEGQRLFILRVDSQDVVAAVFDEGPVAGGDRLVRFVEKRFDPALNSLARHGAPVGSASAWQHATDQDPLIITVPESRVNSPSEIRSGCA